MLDISGYIGNKLSTPSMSVWEHQPQAKFVETFDVPDTVWSDLSVLAIVCKLQLKFVGNR